MEEHTKEATSSSQGEYHGEVSSPGSLVSIVIIVGVILVGGVYYLFFR